MRRKEKRKMKNVKKSCFVILFILVALLGGELVQAQESETALQGLLEGFNTRQAGSLGVQLLVWH